MTGEERPPWEQMPGERAKDYAYFQEYLALGAARSVSKVSKKVQGSASLGRVATRNQWVARAAAWDRDQAETYLAGLVERRREMAERHSRLATVVQNKIVERLRTLDPQFLSPGDLARWLEVATKLERASLGLPESLVGHTGAAGGPVELEVSALTEEERRARLVQLRAELDRRLDDAGADGT